jgi:hypothetical protein
MTQEQWTTGDRYITDFFVPSDPVLDAALQASADARLPPITYNYGDNRQIFYQLLIYGLSQYHHD